MTLGWLLDTNVVSELLKGAHADQSVRSWVDAMDEDELFLSVISLGEIAKGIGLAEARGRDMSSQRDFLDRALPGAFGDRILAFDRPAAVIWGRMLTRFGGDRGEERRLTIDAQIAAIAEAASLRVSTRNTKDFLRLGVTDAFDPFSRTAT